MTATAALLAFTLAAAILTITPGLDTALVLRTAAVEGGRRALMAGLGVCAGCLIWGAIAALGLGSLLAVSTLAYDTLRICAAAYLFYLGAKLLWRTLPGRGSGAGIPPAGMPAAASPQAQAAPVPASASATGWFLRGCLTNALNPKVGIFYITFLPQFIPAGADVLRFSLLLATVHAIVGLLWFALLVAATRPLARWLSRPAVMRGLDRATGAVFIAFGLRLALEKR
ncbi:LysE family translocator [Achromobacter sp. NPDC058515]|uniref:LysE family translocator n=1 Tax=Achromobacter sp. NPDC058515 TaxID=3346533 RepID=UPI003669002B